MHAQDHGFIRIGISKPAEYSTIVFLDLQVVPQRRASRSRRLKLHLQQLFPVKKRTKTRENTKHTTKP